MEDRKIVVKDLTLRITPEGKVILHSLSKRVGGLFDPAAVLVLAFCSMPKTVEEIILHYGASAGELFNRLVTTGLLVSPEEAETTLDFFDSFTNINIHRAMLGDKIRLRKYYEAIKSIVKKGDVVIDAGTGTGILAVYAVKAGAKKVYAIDNSLYIDLAEKVVKENRVEGQVEIIKGDFSKVILPEKADVLVTETFGVMFFTEGASPEIKKLADHYLKTDGVLIPKRFTLSLAPMKNAPYELMNVFKERDDDVDFNCLMESASNKAIIDRVEKDTIGTVVNVGVFPLTTDISEKALEVEVEIEGPCEALCGWFDLILTDNITLSTSPFEDTTSWHQTIFPVSLPEGSHKIRITFGLNPESRRYMYAHFHEPINRKIII